MVSQKSPMGGIVSKIHHQQTEITRKIHASGGKFFHSVFLVKFNALGGRLSAAKPLLECVTGG